MGVQFKKMLVVALAVTVGAAWAAPADDNDGPPDFNLWAALSFSMDRAKSGMDPIGRAYHESSEYVAKEMALRACADNDCEIKVYVNTGCLAVATGMDREGLNWWGFGSSPYARMRDESVAQAEQRSRKEAGEAARDACVAATHGESCNISESFCTWDGGTVSNAAAIQDWIAQFGGEQAPDVQSVVYLVNVTTQGYLINIGLDYQKTSCLSGRRWARVLQMAQTCSLSVDDLDRLYADANRYSHY